MDDSLELLSTYARTRDAQAFAAIVKRHQNLVYSVCLREHRDPHRAEEAAQDCFVKLAQQAADVRTSVSGWLHRCATRVCLQSIRSENARRRREEDYAQMHNNGSEQQSDWAGIAPHIDQAIDELPDDQRHLVVEHFLRQRSQAEIADELNVSPATVSRRTDRAVSALRDGLRRLGVVTSVSLLSALLTQNSVSAAPASLAASLGKLALAGPGPAGAGTAATAVGTSSILGVGAAKLAVGAIVVVAIAVPVVYRLTAGSRQPADAPADAPAAQSAGARRQESAEPVESAEAAAFRKHVAFLASDELGGRATGSEGMARTVAYIANAFAEAGLSPAGDPGDFFQEFEANRKPGVNVVAELPGAGELADQAILLTAHADGQGIDARRARTTEDSIYNSADDAGGVAALLMVASALAEERASLGASRRAVVFVVYDAHERGQVGVQHYRAHPSWPLDKVAAVIQFGGIGRARERRLYAGHAACAPTLQKLLEGLGPECGLEVETHVPCLIPAEYLTFVDAKTPAVLLYTGLHLDFRQVTDHVERLDCESGARIARLAHGLVRHLVVHTQPMVFHPPSPVSDPGTFIRAAQILGVTVTQDFLLPRPRAQTVAPGSIAAQLGIQRGDELVAVNDVPVDRQEDVLAFYGRYGKEWVRNDLRLSLRRDDKRVEVVVPSDTLRRTLGPPCRPLDDGFFEVTFTHRPSRTVRAVYLAGSFNGWKPTGRRMDGPDAQGMYTARVQLPQGKHEYKFVCDGKDWTPGPNNPVRTGWFQNSLLFVGIEPD